MDASYFFYSLSFVFLMVGVVQLVRAWKWRRTLREWRRFMSSPAWIERERRLDNDIVFYARNGRWPTESERN